MNIHTMSKLDFLELPFPDKDSGEFKSLIIIPDYNQDGYKMSIIAIEKLNGELFLVSNNRSDVVHISVDTSTVSIDILENGFTRIFSCDNRLFYQSTSWGLSTRIYLG